MPTTYQFPTYMMIGKDRFNGAIKRYCMMSSFDIRRGEYEKEYKLFTIKRDGEEVELVPDSKIPEWAVHARREDRTFKSRYGGK